MRYNGRDLNNEYLIVSLGQVLQSTNFYHKLILGKTLIFKDKSRFSIISK